MNKTKKDILERINNTYCRLKASSIQGIGVFAIRDIPENINPDYLNKNGYDFPWKNLEK